MQARKTQAVEIAEEAKSVLYELGAILNQRYRDRGPSFQTQQSLRRKNAVITRLDQFITDQQRVSELERSNGEDQTAAIKRLQKQLEDQKATFEQERESLQDQKERLQKQLEDQKATFEQERESLQDQKARLQKQLEDQKATFEQERERLLQQQATQTSIAQVKLRSSLDLMLPQLRELLEVYDREEREYAGQDQSTITRTATITGDTSNQDAARRLNTLQTSFDRERAQLLKKATDAANAQQAINRRNLSEREAMLTCPISLELFENPVVTTCCGKTFSSETLSQALRQTLNVRFVERTEFRRMLTVTWQA
ncbi:hypothetical protein DVH05_019945 [Phytophthora capsici]|nr:hypothetical protein DVH05_019945 [Phytophthora capsici]